VVSEISRTDTTKRKNILIEAFSRVHRINPNTFLVIAIDNNERDLSLELRGMIERTGIASHTAVIGNEWDRLPFIYALSSVYCSPSIMEGFGMSVQEAAASGIPVVGSSLIPFVTEYLLGDNVTEVPYINDFGIEKTLHRGRGGIAVEPDDPAGFAAALALLIQNEAMRLRMGKAAYSITIPYFTWDTMVDTFLEAIQQDRPDDGQPISTAKKVGVAI
jgi:glycosyltransferase involved in cell wall biosynthesis